MIEVQIRLSPQGQTHAQQLIGQLWIVNDDTGTALRDNYDYVLDGKQGRVENWLRDRSPWSLVHHILRQEHISA